MASYQAPGTARATEGNASTAPLVVLFERDDAIAVPLLSQLRMAGYDVRAARTPVDLFDLLGKQLVSLVLVDLGAATAGRREFWVALDAQRRGRALQVMTFRQISPAHPLDAEGDPSARALADVEVAGPQDFHKVIQGVRQRIPLHGGNGAFPTALPLPGGAAQIGQSPFGTAAPPSRPFGMPGFDPMQMPSAAPQFPPMPTGMPSSYGTPPPYPTQGPGYPAGQPMPSHRGFSGGPALPGQPAPPYGQAPFGQAPFGQAPFGQAPYGPPPSYPGQMPSPSQARPYPGEPYAPQPSQMPGQLPGGAPPWAPGPAAANPATANPYGMGNPVGGPGGHDASRFAQPYTVNPFAGDGTPGGPAPFAPQPPSAHVAPAWGGPSPATASPFDAPSQVNPFASPAPAGQPFGFGERSGFYAPNGGDHAQGGASRFGGSGPQEVAAPSPAGASISDTWIPPDEDAAVQTGIVPEIAYHAGQPLASERAGMEWGTNPNQAEWGGAPRPGGWEQPAAFPPAAAATRNLPAVQSQADQALGTVLVEGALLTPSKLEVLRGVQAMLGSVRMEYKLGELALLFRFLSPDQLLAALLVSRGLVTPQQIAGLGRVKQELAASGMDHDLESLLMMFHILSPDQLRQIRAELS
jgi:hypothetical protein